MLRTLVAAAVAAASLTSPASVASGPPSVKQATRQYGDGPVEVQPGRRFGSGSGATRATG